MTKATKAKLLGLRTVMLDDRCTAGERDNAERLYYRLLEKYNLSDKDIEPQETSIVWIRYDGEFERSLLHQIVGKTLEAPHLEYYKGKRRRDGFELTLDQQERITQLFKTLKVALRKELEYCLKGFIQSNRLGVLTRDDDLSEEDQEELRRVMAYMGVIEPTPVPQTERSKLLASHVKEE